MENNKHKKRFDEILKEISKIINKYKKETDLNFEGLDVAVLIEDLDSEIKKLKIIYDEMD